ncbi:MAG TPA: oligopeptide/dipeptide ABC transporter ATP-binding protein [Proteiniclasticum sp.]|nr:oligopeptide/dipeptide ABC transporter ATP-binding protein [Proteiniclasticum sp.]
MIEVKDLKKYFIAKNSVFGDEKELIHAVNGIDFKIDQGKTLGLVGESGSGKSTTGRLVLRLLEPTSGSIHLDGKDISTISNKDFRKLRKELQMVFQNPYSALDYKMTIEDILVQPLQIHKIVQPLDYKKEVYRLLDLVGLDKASAKKFPHEFSGGQRQRIGIARALSTKPRFIVCDEPVSALDVSVQSQIINLTMDLQKEFGLSYLFIAHDLHVIKHVSDEVAVMYLGKIVENGDSELIFSHPMHPYTKALLAAVPGQKGKIVEERKRLKGEIPSSIKMPEGCAFHTRCPYAMDICKEIIPILKKHEKREVACHLF